MVGLAERPSWIPVADMVLPGSIGAKLIPGISDLEERERPDTTFNQSFTLPSFTRQNPDLITYGDILRLPPEELDKFDPGFRLRERLTDYLKDQLILPHSRLLGAAYGWPVFPVPPDREQEIITGVEDVLNEMEHKRQTTLILRFGLYDGIIHTLEEIGQGFNPVVTRERIRQLEAGGLKILKRLIGVNIRDYRVIPEVSFGIETPVGEDPLKRKRRERLGEPRNNLIKGIELSSGQFEELDNILLEELNLSNSAYNKLRRGDIRTIGELLRTDERRLRYIQGIGSKTGEEIIKELTAFLNAFLKSQ